MPRSAESLKSLWINRLTEPLKGKPDEGGGYDRNIGKNAPANWQ